MTRTVLVTGAAGFIGAALSQRLLQQGDRVVGGLQPLLWPWANWILARTRGQGGRVGTLPARPARLSRLRFRQPPLCLLRESPSHLRLLGGQCGSGASPCQERTVHRCRLRSDLVQCVVNAVNTHCSAGGAATSTTTARGLSSATNVELRGLHRESVSKWTSGNLPEQSNLRR